MHNRAVPKSDLLKPKNLEAIEVPSTKVERGGGQPVIPTDSLEVSKSLVLWEGSYTFTLNNLAFLRTYMRVSENRGP